MPRNRVIYQTESLYAGPSPATGYHAVSGAGVKVNPRNLGATSATGLVREIKRVQGVNYSFNIPRTDVNQFGELAAIDRIILEQPTVSLDFNYILNGLSNERSIGLLVATPGSGSLVSAITNILNKSDDERNFFIKTVTEGNDVAGSSDIAPNSVTESVIGIGNAFISAYSTEASVGNFPTVSVTYEALNMTVDAFSTGQNVPAVNSNDGTIINGVYYTLPTGKQSIDGTAINTTDYSISALRPGDVTLNLGTSELGPDFADMKVQNYTLSFDLTRQPLQKLGSKYAFSREIQFPVSVSLSVTADLGTSVTGNMANVINANSTYNPSIAIKAPGQATKNAAYYEVRGAKLDSVDFSSSIGPNKSATMKFSAQLGGPQATGVGLFMSGLAI
jgi:hypothetical protein